MDGPTGLRLIRYWITRADGPGYLNRWPFGPKNRNATLVENRYETSARVPDNFEIRPVLRIVPPLSSGLSHPFESCPEITVVSADDSVMIVWEANRRQSKLVTGIIIEDDVSITFSQFA